MEYCGVDLHAEYSQICILDEDGEVMKASRVRTSRKALERFFLRDSMRTGALQVPPITTLTTWLLTSNNFVRLVMGGTLPEPPRSWRSMSPGVSGRCGVSTVFSSRVPR
jgi:hypothetical protein